MADETAPTPEERKAIQIKGEQAAKLALLKRIDNDYTYHSPKGDQTDRYGIIRETAKKLARVMIDCCPPSRELSLALTDLEMVVMRANAAIARNE